MQLFFSTKTKSGFSLRFCPARSYITKMHLIIFDPGENEHDRPMRPLPNFQNALLNGHSIPIEGDGSQSRTFTWIEDVIDALIEIMRYENRLPVVMNLGSEETVTILELAKMMAIIMGVKPEFEYTNRLSGDPDWRRPDCSLLRKTIGWAPNTTIEIGLQKLLQVNEEINT